MVVVFVMMSGVLSFNRAVSIFSINFFIDRAGSLMVIYRYKLLYLSR